jgi:WhiB family transcriptional regulator, redox-sensing transcriptional regulator
MFFPEEDRGQRLRRTEEEAKCICRGCPVVNRCLEHALAAPETHGI